MKQFLSKRAQRLTPYIAGEQPANAELIKLNTNENPYPPSPAAMNAARMSVLSSLRRYPKTDGGVFREAAAKLNGVSKSQVFCANGSDELLSFCFAAFFDPGRPVKTPNVSYSFYPVWAEFYGIELEFVPLREDFTLPADQMLAAPGGVIFPNPNAPTGLAL